MVEHVMLVPPTGLIEVLEGVDPHPDGYTLLAARGGRGQHIELCVSIDTDYKFTIEWHQDPTATVNERAREILHSLTGSLMIFTGPVLFSDLPSETVFGLVSEFSRRE